MTEQFDAEQWLREGGEVYDQTTANAMRLCADELAAAKARIAELEADLQESDDVRAKLALILDNCNFILKGKAPELTHYSWHDIPELIEAEQAMSRKLYEALQCVDLTSGEVNPQVVIEAIAEYENKERK